MHPIRIIRAICCCIPLLAANPTNAQDGPGPRWGDLNRALVDGHIIPRYQVLARATAGMNAEIRDLCERPTQFALVVVRAGFGRALDAWNGISHIRFGPVETDQRYFRFQLWPDRRGTGQRQVLRLLSDQDEGRLAPAAFALDSVAVQGLSALEMLLFPEDQVGVEDFSSDDGPSFRCRFVQAIADNLAAMAAATLADWTLGEHPYRLALVDPGMVSDTTAPTGQAHFTDERAVSAELLKALNTGAQVIHQSKLAKRFAWPAAPGTSCWYWTLGDCRRLSYRMTQD